MRSGVDILIVGIDSTGGWSAAAADLAAGLTRAGASALVASTGPVPRVRTFALTDLSQAWMARRVAQRGIREHAPAAIIYCSVTASLLWPRPGAISLDSIAAENRPGRHGIWQRRVERLRLAQAPLLLLWSQRALAPLHGEHAPTCVVPPTVDLPDAVDPRPGQDPGAAGAPREIDVVAYAGDPEKRRLEYVLDAWRGIRREHETLFVAGHEGLRASAGVQSAGRLSRAEFRRLLSRTKVFVSAPRREDFGIAALEALAAGCMLVTTPAPGPYPALELARALDPRLVANDIGPALRVALDDPLAGYAQRAAALLEPFGSEAVDRTIARDVLPRLLAGWSAQLP